MASPIFLCFLGILFACMGKKYYLCNLNKTVYFFYMKNRIEILKGLHPGVFLQYELDKQNLKSGKFAESIGEHPQTLSAIIRGRRSMNIPLSLRIENALNLEEGLLMTLQVYYDIAQEKLKLVKKNKPDLSKFRSVLFWDTSLENIDFDEHKQYVINRVFERGLDVEIEEIVRFYDCEVILESIRKDKKSLFESVVKDNLRKYLNYEG